jgi:hypothetical protein
VCRGGQPAIEVVSAFYCGRFTDYENTFEAVEEPNYAATLEIDADVGVLQSKEWFSWGSSPPMLAGITFIFHVRSQVPFKDKTLFKNLVVPVADAASQHLVKVLPLETNPTRKFPVISVQFMSIPTSPALFPFLLPLPVGSG